MLKVLNTRNNKTGQAEKISDDMYKVKFDDGDEKMINSTTIKRWYQVLSDTDAEGTPASDETPETTVDTTEAAPADETSATLEDAPESDPEASDDEANAEAEKAAAEAAKEAEKEKVAAAKKAEKEAKKAADEKEKAAKKAEAEKLKAEKAAEAARKKAEKANATPRDGNMKKVHKEFFTKFLEALNAKESSVTKANARDRNYMSFPAGASGFKFKFVKTGNKLDCSLYIFGPAVVTAALFKELEKHKIAIEAQLSYELDWSAPEDMKVRRVRTAITGTDEELVEKGVDVLLDFRRVLVGYVDKITA